MAIILEFHNYNCRDIDNRNDDYWDNKRIGEWECRWKRGFCFSYVYLTHKSYYYISLKFLSISDSFLVVRFLINSFIFCFMVIILWYYCSVCWYKIGSRTRWIFQVSLREWWCQLYALSCVNDLVWMLVMTCIVLELILLYFVVRPWCMHSSSSSFEKVGSCLCSF